MNPLLVGGLTFALAIIVLVLIAIALLILAASDLDELNSKHTDDEY